MTICEQIYVRYYFDSHIACSGKKIYIYVELPMLPNSTICQQQVNAEDQINIEIVKRVSCDMIIMRALPSNFHKCVHVLVMQKCVQVVTKGTRDQCRKLGRNPLMVFRKKFNRNNRNQNYNIIKSSKLVSSKIFDFPIILKIRKTQHLIRQKRQSREPVTHVHMNWSNLSYSLQTNANQSNNSDFTYSHTKFQKLNQGFNRHFHSTPFLYFNKQKKK